MTEKEQGKLHNFRLSGKLQLKKCVLLQTKQHKQWHQAAINTLLYHCGKIRTSTRSAKQGFRLVLEDRIGNTWYFSYCKQTPRKDQQCVSLYLNIYWHPTSICTPLLWLPTEEIWRKSIKMGHRFILYFFKTVSNFLKQLGSVVFSKHYEKRVHLFAKKKVHWLGEFVQ